MYSGFVAPGYGCQETESRTFYNNVAHSVRGYGAYLYPSPVISSDKCVMFSHFTAYKTELSCVVTFAKTLHLKGHNFNCIDNEKGLSLSTGNQEADEIFIDVYDSFFHGEMRSEDCPKGNHCRCNDKQALMNG